MMAFDRLHTLFSGLWGAHFWPLLIRVLREISAENLDLIDSRFVQYFLKYRILLIYMLSMGQVPRVAALPHFLRVANEQFTDGKKRMAILQVW
jgi:hypothetical protein